MHSLSLRGGGEPVKQVPPPPIPVQAALAVPFINGTSQG